MHGSQHYVCREIAEALGLKWAPTAEVSRALEEFAQRIANPPGGLAVEPPEKTTGEAPRKAAG